MPQGHMLLQAVIIMGLQLFNQPGLLLRSNPFATLFALWPCQAAALRIPLDTAFDRIQADVKQTCNADLAVASLPLLDDPFSQIDRIRPHSSSSQVLVARQSTIGSIFMKTAVVPKMARIAITPEWVGVLDFETRFPSALEKAMAGA